MDHHVATRIVHFLKKMKAFSSICLSIPWWYVLGTQKHLSKHEYSFLVINALVTIMSMVHRHFNTKLTGRLDYTMICAIQFSFHLFSDIYRPIIVGLLVPPISQNCFSCEHRRICIQNPQLFTTNDHTWNHGDWSLLSPS